MTSTFPTELSLQALVTNIWVSLSCFVSIKPIAGSADGRKAPELSVKRDWDHHYW